MAVGLADNRSTMAANSPYLVQSRDGRRLMSNNDQPAPSPVLRGDHCERDEPDRTLGVATDSDIDLRVGSQRREWSRRRELLPVIAVGGMLGASARYAGTLASGNPGSAWPWATLAINVTGCFLIGLLMVWVAERGGAHPLLRPFLGVGVLGGYTTFSSYAVEGHDLIAAGRPLLGLAYLWVTVIGAVAAVTIAALLARAIADRRGPNSAEEFTAASTVRKPGDVR